MNLSQHFHCNKDICPNELIWNAARAPRLYDPAEYWSHNPFITVFGRAVFQRFDAERPWHPSYAGLGSIGHFPRPSSGKSPHDCHLVWKAFSLFLSATLCTSIFSCVLSSSPSFLLSLSPPFSIILPSLTSAGYDSHFNCLYCTSSHCLGRDRTPECTAQHIHISDFQAGVQPVRVEIPPSEVPQ